MISSAVHFLIIAAIKMLTMTLQFLILNIIISIINITITIYGASFSSSLSSSSSSSTWLDRVAPTERIRRIRRVGSHHHHLLHLPRPHRMRIILIIVNIAGRPTGAYQEEDRAIDSHEFKPRQLATTTQPLRFHPSDRRDHQDIFGIF